MVGSTLRRRRWPTAVLIAAAALAIGSVFGVPGNGQAASEAAPANTASPTISGTAQAGVTLTAGNGTWSGTPTSYSYTWSRCDQNGSSCSTISGATAQTYQLQQADVGSTLRATVTATNADGPGQATSAPTSVIQTSGAAPANTAPPIVSGTAQAGSTLTAANGTWSNTPTGYAYAWSRCDQNGSSCSAISGATAQTFQLQQVDVGSTLRVAVTADAAESAAAIGHHEADLVVVRADLNLPPEALSVAIFRKNLVVFWLPNGGGLKGQKKESNIAKVANLSGRRVGVIGKTPANLDLLKIILTESGVAADKVEVVQFGTSDLVEAFRNQKVDAFMAVGPVDSKITADAIAATTKSNSAVTFLPIDAAEIVARKHPVYESSEIAAGAFGASPSRPDDDVTTIAPPLPAAAIARPHSCTDRKTPANTSAFTNHVVPNRLTP